MKNASFNTNDVKKCCENKLDIEFRKKGKEFNGWFKINEVKICRITVPKGRKSIGKGLYYSLAVQLKLTAEEFDELLECPLIKNEYEKILRKQNIISNIFI